MHGPLLLQDPGTEDKMRVSLTEKEWSFINEIILNIHSPEDNVRMRQTFFDLLRHGIHKADKTFKPWSGRTAGSRAAFQGRL